jgi:AcrR family transcriptional regulator
MTKKEKEAEFKRNLVMEAAWVVFMKKGFAAATMNDIAEKSDYALGTIYKLFQSKGEIFILLVKKKLEELHNNFLLSDDPSKDPIERIRAILNVSIDYFFKNMRMAQLFEFEPWAGDIQMAKNLRIECREQFQNFTKLFLEIIEKGIEQGYFRKLESSKVRLVIKALINEFYWDKILNGDRIETSDLVDEVMSFLLYGIANQPGTLNK